jgi:hypothetical protein
MTKQQSHRLIAALGTVLAVLSSQVRAADIGTAFTYQGSLENPPGTPLNDTCTFEFKLCDAALPAPCAPGTISNHPGISVSGGLFTVQNVNFGAGAINGTARWLDIMVNCGNPGDPITLSPRHELTPAPHALALPALWTTPDDNAGFTLGGNVIGGHRDNTVGAGVGSAVIAGGGGLLAEGSGPNQVTGSWGVIGGGDGNTAGPGNDPTVGGGFNNIAGGHDSTVGGGFTNRAAGDYSAVGGGQYNTASDPFSTVGGGAGNAAGGEDSTVAGRRDNTASGYTATIGGGFDNEASDIASTVGGGDFNIASAADSTVAGGGNNNAIGNFSAVGGGQNNQAIAFYATVAGGATNIVTDDYGTVAGGENNRAGDSAGTATDKRWATVGGGDFNIASAADSTVAGGGSLNTAGGNGSTIGGCGNNAASGLNATVAGGSSNSAAGARSFAAGHNAKANHAGAFVWADDIAVDYPSTTVNQFNVRASGGTRIHSNSTATVGVQLAVGGNSWSAISDRNVKQNVTPVDSRDVLERLAGIPIGEWNLISQDPSIRHIGPMAQDFHAAFRAGEMETHISSSDADGVALAAIQGLYQIVQEKDCRIGELEDQNTELQSRLAALETLVSKLAAQQNGGGR